ncbi:ABC transporter permease [Glutamicibacter sp.]|uniref:ABC transporter permease n=1 Tax=Glutamicibacter sp. TaxID=1931995 RepID=UPI003D6B8746
MSPAHRQTTANTRSGSLAGTGQLLRFMLRRDRIRFPAWILGLSLMLDYFANALGLVLDEQSLATFAVFAANPVMALIGGPGYGFEAITLGRFLVGMYGVFLMIGAGLMGITTISRHTRAEEQSGRAELIRANAVGRHAQLAAALALATLMNLALAVLMTLVFMASPAQAPAPSAFLFSCGVAAAGLVFCAVAALAVQLSAYSRAASGLAGAVLAASFMARGLGDMSAAQGGKLSWLSWLSPFGWSQHTAPLVLDRWWPLLLSLAAAVLLSLAGFALQSRRDLAAGILPDRTGGERAPGWLGSPLALAFRLQRSALAWWSFALLLSGIVFGAFVQPMAENAAGMPEELLAVFGGAQGMVEGYLGFMSLYLAILVSVFAILSVLSLRGEEQAVRAEPILAASVSRAGWLASWVLVTVLGSLWLMLLGGVGNGIGAGLSTGDWTLLAQATLGHLVQTPSVWVLAGLATALYGFLPRLASLAWAVFAYCSVLGFFGEMLQLDQPVLDSSVFLHIGQYPAAEIDWTAVGGLSLLAVALIALGAAGFRRRDLITA